MRENSLNNYKESSDLKGTIPESYNFYNNISTSISPIYNFPRRETFFTRQIKVQIGQSTSIIFFIKGKMPTFAGKKHPSVLFFPHGSRVFQLSTEKMRVGSVGNGHQSG